jgi:hypothetical protein
VQSYLTISYQLHRLTRYVQEVDAANHTNPAESLNRIFGVSRNFMIMMMREMIRNDVEITHHA